jgi:hypothetical protein
LRRLPVAAALIATFALLLVVLGDGAEVDSDLQLCSPPEVTPGAELPLRAALYAGLLAVEGPKLLVTDVAVELRAVAGNVLARGQLRAAVGGMLDMEGTLRVPPDYRGNATLVARARVGDDVLQVESPLRVREGAAGQASTPRAMRATAHLVEGPVRAEAGHVPPSALRVRVAGGACVPESPCAVLVHVGAPAASVVVQPSAALSMRGGGASPVTEHVARFEVVVHGPEAELQLQVVRDGVVVGHRKVRLPVALGAVGVTLEPRVVDSEEPVTLAMLGDAGGCIVDMFSVDARAESRWLHTASLRDCERGVRLPFGALSPGAYRVQVRRDALSSSTAGVAALLVRASDEPPSVTSERLLSWLRAAGRSDARAIELLSAADHGLAMRYLLAAVETDLVIYPAMITGYAQSLFRQSEARAEVRVVALAALLIAGLGLAAFVGRRGLRASERASAILLEAGQDPETSERSHLRGISVVLASVLALLLVFAVVALYVMARGMFR